jgi:hypothetical protein
MPPPTRYLILAVISKGIVELWEALMTLALFPTFVFVAWLVERKFFYLCPFGKKKGHVDD